MSLWRFAGHAGLAAKTENSSDEASGAESADTNGSVIVAVRLPGSAHVIGSTTVEVGSVAE